MSTKTYTIEITQAETESWVWSVRKDGFVYHGVTESLEEAIGQATDALLEEANP